MITVGTGAQIVVPLSAPAVPGPAPVTHTYRSAVPVSATAGWYRMGAVQSAGLVLERVAPGSRGLGRGRRRARHPPGRRPRVPPASGGGADAVVWTPIYAARGRG